MRDLTGMVFFIPSGRISLLHCSTKFLNTEGTYLVIDVHEGIVTSADFKPMTENVELHILFEAQGEKTLFTFHCVHETEEYCAQQEKMGFYSGWGSVFNNLKTYVEKTD